MKIKFRTRFSKENFIIVERTLGYFYILDDDNNPLINNRFYLTSNGFIDALDPQYKFNRKEFVNNHLFEEDRDEELERALVFGGELKKKNSIHRVSSSYGLKHICEEYHRKRGAKNPYVSNGYFILGMIESGFDVELDIDGIGSPCSPNGYFNIDRWSLKRIMKEF